MTHPEESLHDALTKMLSRDIADCPWWNPMNHAVSWDTSVARRCSLHVANSLKRSTSASDDVPTFIPSVQTITHPSLIMLLIKVLLVKIALAAAAGWIMLALV